MNRFFAFCVCALLAGCASARLDIYADLYKGNPRFVAPMTPSKVANLIGDIERLRAEAEDKTAQRKYLASTSVELYLNTWNEVAADASVSKALNEKLAEFTKSADAAMTVLGGKFNAAVAGLEEYSMRYKTQYDLALGEFKQCEKAVVEKTTLPDDVFCTPSVQSKPIASLGDEWVLRRLAVKLEASEAKARGEIKKAVSAYESFSAPIEKSFIIDWAGLRSRLYSALSLAEQGRNANNIARMKRAVYGLNLRMKSLAESSNLLPSTDLRALDNEARNSSTGPSESTLRIAVELESLRSNLPDNASAQAALSGLVQNSTSFGEMIDRLQDSGDAVWRIVTDPENEIYWNKEPALTRSYAQGNSSVVIVRQDVDRYDVHDANNNPTALIKGQLEVSRAVANAAISVASASAGIKMPKASGEAEKAGDKANPNAESEANEEFAKRKAAAEEAERARQNALRGLSMELSNISMNLASSGDNAAALATQRTRLQSVLAAYRTLIAASVK